MKETNQKISAPNLPDNLMNTVQQNQVFSDIINNPQPQSYRLRDRWFGILVILVTSIVFGLTPSKLLAREIFRFEHIGTEDGLSQNTVASILCDSKGFLWLGTNDGLNRYDGYNFKVFKSNVNKQDFFANNRIVEIWEDARGNIWFATHDGYYHCLNPENEMITSYPHYLGKIMEGNIIFTDFVQYSVNEIWLGLKNQGLLRLTYDSETNAYLETQFINKGQQSITNNNISFIHKDLENNLWIGTEQGINFSSEKQIVNGSPSFQHLLINYHFTTCCESSDTIWFGTQNAGLITYSKKTNQYTFQNRENSSTLPSNHINRLFLSGKKVLLAAFENQGLYAHFPEKSTWKKLPVRGTEINSIYQDHSHQIWVTTNEFGITRIDPKTLETRHYSLATENGGNIPDIERHFFYEDRQQHLWIGLHGGALASYNRENDRFQFYRNNPQNPYSISSNIVHCITEDRSGQLWVGTGQYLGGLEKVILRNPAFQHLLLQQPIKDIADNLARSIGEDPEHRLWVATKAGRLYVMDENYRPLHTFHQFKTQKGILAGVNVYTILLDRDHYLWLGSKGKGILVSSKPITRYRNYGEMDFINYQHLEKDSASLSHNNVYSLAQDQNGTIWAGTYGNGVNRVKIHPDGSRSFEAITAQNSNLSSNMVRQIYFDSFNRMWVATGFGLNVREASPIDSAYQFETYLFDPEEKNSISYNDVVHIKEDSQKNIWLGTLGGGVCKIKFNDNMHPQFKRFNSTNGLSSDIVFGILKDRRGDLWFSTENGLNCFKPENNTFEVYNINNGLSFSSFSENTCLLKSDGALLFGGYLGLEVVHPEKLISHSTEQTTELTNFQLFNKTLSVSDPGSPLKKSIPYTDELVLTYDQSSFSVEYSALDFLDPDKIQYAFRLENFDQNWNFVGNQTKATYTNLPPGKYRFKVKASNRQGELSSKYRELKITLLPPWWETWPAYLGYFLLSVLFLLVIRKTILKINQYRNELTIEKRVNEEKLKFFTNISHEIRTPLTLILGPVEDLMKKMGDSMPEYKKDLSLVYKNGKRMLQLINQLLEFRKIQNNKMLLRVKQFDIVNFTREIFESFQPLATHKGISLHFKSDRDEFPIWADPSKLDIVIYNLVSNAVKFTGSNKKVEITISCPAPENQLIIAVKDEGPGIPQNNLKYLFSRFTILSDKELSGTGIGLSLAYEITKLHHGDLVVESEEKAGSLFQVKLMTGKEHFENRDDVTFSDREDQPVTHPTLAGFTADLPTAEIQGHLNRSR